jgi:hypothetical protein
VLLHLRDRQAVLERLCRAVAPGGCLVIGETAGDPGFTWVRTLPRRLAELGLADIGIQADTPPLTDGGSLARSFAMTLDALTGTAVEQGLIDTGTITRATALLADPGFTDLAMTLIHTWGRQP